jgi:hypothetical protein
MRPNLENAELHYILDSVFLPPKLPQEDEENRRQKDCALLELVTSVTARFATIEALSMDEKSTECWRRIQIMLQSMSFLHSSDSLSKQDLTYSLLQMKQNGI